MGSHATSFGVLGPVAAFDQQGAVVPVVGRRQERLLCALLAASPHAVSADRLIEAVWPNDPPSGPGPLRTVASRLRSSLGGLIVSRGTGYAIEGCSIDSGGFEALSARSREALPLEATRLLDEALGLWRGRPFEELEDVDWVQPLAVRLNELRCEAVERQAEALIELCELGSAAAVLEAHCISEPLRERPHGLLMTAYARDGRAADGLRVYERFRSRLRDEIGLSPSPWLRDVEQSILVGLETTRLETTVQPATSSGADRRPLGWLPRIGSSFVGRRAELEETVQWLKDRTYALVTIVGAGGVGKTRLAVQVARQCWDGYEHGAWMVEFAEVGDPARVVAACAEALEIDVATGDPHARLIESLRERELLLLLDNCEHVVEAAAALAARIARDCERVSILATSREPLHIIGERVQRLTPLDEHAVELFVDRAEEIGGRIAESELGTVREICDRLDNLPLAIELAAAHADYLSPLEIVKQLETPLVALSLPTRDAKARHAGLDAAIRWSWDLLTIEERFVLSACSVFRGGWTPDAAIRVCGLRASLPEVVAVLSSLARKSLLTVDHGGPDTRYSMLETMREFASERLHEQGDAAAVGRRHSEWGQVVLARCLSLCDTPDEASGAELFDAEAANIRAGFDWALAVGDIELVSSYAVELASSSNTNVARLALPVERAKTLAGASSLPHWAYIVAAERPDSGNGLVNGDFDDVIEQIDVDGVDIRVRGAVRMRQVYGPLMFGLRSRSPRHLERLAAIAEQTGLAKLRAWTWHGRAAQTTDENERSRLLADALRLSQETGAPAGFASHLVAEMMSHLLAGSYGEAAAIAKPAHAYALAGKNQGVVSFIGYLTGYPAELKRDVLLNRAELVRSGLSHIDPGPIHPIRKGLLMGLASTLAVAGRTQAAARIGRAMIDDGWAFDVQPILATALEAHPIQAPCSLLELLEFALSELLALADEVS